MCLVKGRWKFATTDPPRLCSGTAISKLCLASTRLLWVEFDEGKKKSSFPMRRETACAILESKRKVALL